MPKPRTITFTPAPLNMFEGDDPAVNDTHLEARLTDLEGRYAFLDDLLHHLEGVVTAQQRIIDELRDQLEQTRAALKNVDLSDGSKQNEEPPPPHY